MKPNTVIFDLDDTLVYVPKEFEHAWTRKCFQNFAGKTFDDEFITKYLNKPIADREYILMKLGFTSRQQYLDMWLTGEAIAKYVESMKVFTDVSVLKELKQKRIKIGMVTAGGLHRVSKQIEKLEEIIGEKIFNLDYVVNIHGTSLPMKPAPDALLEGVRRLNTEPHNTLYVGDNIKNDMEMAVRAGVKPVLIDRTARTNSEQYTVISNLRKLLELLK